MTRPPSTIAPAKLLALAGLLALPAMPAVAANSYDNCTGFVDSLPATIASPGTWCLRRHLSTAMADGEAILIAASDVTLDCNDFKIGGLAAGAATETTGVYALMRSNVTIRNCGIRGFQQGLVITGSASGGTLVEDNRFDNNTYRAITTATPGALLRRNRVYDTGGSTVVNFARAIWATGAGSEVIDNEIRGVLATEGGGGTAIGIYLASADDIKVIGNRIAAVAGDGAGQAYGIYAGESAIVTGNSLTHAGKGGVGIECNAASSVAHGNQVIGFATAVANCTEP